MGLSRTGLMENQCPAMETGATRQDLRPAASLLRDAWGDALGGAVAAPPKVHSWVILLGDSSNLKAA